MLQRGKAHLHLVVQRQLPAFGKKHHCERHQGGGKDARGGAKVPDCKIIHLIKDQVGWLVPVRVRDDKASEDPEDPDGGVQTHGKADVERFSVILPHSSKLQ